MDVNRETFEWMKAKRSRCRAGEFVCVRAGACETEQFKFDEILSYMCVCFVYLFVCLFLSLRTLLTW